MEFKIENRPVFTSLRIIMKAGENFKAESGAMVAMSPSIELKAKSTGKGLMGALGAAMGGEKLFGSLFTANGDGELILAPGTPGDIVHLKLDNKTIFAQAGAYLAGSPDLEITTKLSGKALISSEGLFLSKVSGNGILFLNSYGAVVERELAAGETFIVDTGHIVAFEETVNFKVKKAAKGLFSTVASGEMLVAEYSGPGKIWLQTRNLSAFGAALARFIPKS